MRANRVATLSEQEIEDRLESARDELRKIRDRYDRKLKDVAADFSELVQMPGVDPQSRIDEIREAREAELATQRRHVERLEKAAEEARRERESQTDLFGARENRSMGAEEILQKSEQMEEELEERENPPNEHPFETHNRLFGGESGVERLNPEEEGVAEENARGAPLPDELPEGQTETFSANVEKLSDREDPPPTRLTKAWREINIEFAFNPQDWHMDPERTADRFDLRGVQFGRWMEADMRVAYLARAAQGLEELRRVIGTTPDEIPPESIGNGEITLALGARGKGGSHAAHYEPSTMAVNFTKTKGPGSLAHEMAHALDHRAARQIGTVDAGGTYATDRGGPARSISDGVIRAILAGESTVHSLAEESFARLVYKDVPPVSEIGIGDTKMENDLTKRQWAVDLYEVADEYWIRRIEIFARGFETWVQRAVEKEFNGRTNRFLTKIERVYRESKHYPTKEAVQEAGGVMQEFMRRVLLNEEGEAGGEGESEDEGETYDPRDHDDLRLRGYIETLKSPEKRDEKAPEYAGRYTMTRLERILEAFGPDSRFPQLYTEGKLQELKRKTETLAVERSGEMYTRPESWAEKETLGESERVEATVKGAWKNGTVNHLRFGAAELAGAVFTVNTSAGTGLDTWTLEGNALDVVEALLLAHEYRGSNEAVGNESRTYVERAELTPLTGEKRVAFDNGEGPGRPYSTWTRGAGAAEKIEDALVDFAAKTGVNDASRSNPRRNRIQTLEEELSGAAQLQDILPEGRAMIHVNDQNGGIEIYFPGQQPEETTQRLKEAGFWYDPATKGGLNYWWAEQTPERMELAKELAADPQALKVGEGEEVQGLGRSDEVEVFDVPISDVNTDPDRFQPRGGDYSEKTASRIVEDFDPELMDPIDLWRDPDDGNLYVLAGHSRLEGFKRRDDKDTIPAEVLDVSEEEAIKYALIENESGTDLTPSERAGVLNDIVEAEEIDTISGRKEKAKDLFGKAGNEVFALSYLDPSGPLMQTLKQFEGSGSTEADDVLQMAKWVGKIRRFNRELSDLHERNLWEYLQDNFKTQGREFSSFVGFREYVQQTIDRQFFGEEIDPETPLNLDRVDPKSDQEEEIDRMLEEKKEELREARRELRKKREELIERGAEGEDLERALQPFQEEVNATQQELVEMEERAKRERGRLKEQEQGLFAGARGNQSFAVPQWVHFGRTAGLDVELTDGRTMEIRMDSEGGGHLFTAVEMDQLILVESPLVKVAAPAEGDEAERAFEEFHRFDPEERPGGEQDYIFEIPGGEAELLGEAKTLYYRSDKVMRDGDEPGEMHSYYHHFDSGHPVEKVSGTGGVYAVGSCLGDILPSGFRCKEIEVDERGILN